MPCRFAGKTHELIVFCVHCAKGWMRLEPRQEGPRARGGQRLWTLGRVAWTKKRTAEGTARRCVRGRRRPFARAPSGAPMPNGRRSRSGFWESASGKPGGCSCCAPRWCCLREPRFWACAAAPGPCCSRRPGSWLRPCCRFAAGRSSSTGTCFRWRARSAPAEPPCACFCAWPLRATRFRHCSWPHCSRRLSAMRFYWSCGENYGQRWPPTV